MTMIDGDRVHDALTAAWERLCGVLEGARFERRNGYVWTVCPPVPLPGFNGIWPEDDSAAPQLEAALAEITALGLPGSIQLRRGKAAAACARETERLGLLLDEEIPAMAVDAAALRDADVPELQILRVRTGDGLAQALAIAADGFGAPPEMFAPLYSADVAELDGITVYVGRAGDVDVTTGLGFVVGDAVGIFNIATPIDHRGRGYGAAVTACAVRDGFAAGAEFACLQSSELGYRVYHRLGFRELERYELYTAPEAPFVDVAAT